MKWILRAMVVNALLALPAVAKAGEEERYFPLKRGNSWTLENPLALPQRMTMTVGLSQGTRHRLTRFPMLPPHTWVAFSGPTLWAWDARERRWEPFLRFGARDGTAYPFHMLGNGPIRFLKVWRPQVPSENPILGRSFTDTIMFSDVTQYAPETWGPDLVFAKDVGPVEYGDYTPQSYEIGFLASASVDGHRLGRVSYSKLEAGTLSGHPSLQDGSPSVFTFNQTETWTAFYRQHRPGTRVPEVNFRKSSVLVVDFGAQPLRMPLWEPLRVLWDWESAEPRALVRPNPLPSSEGEMSARYLILILEDKVPSVVPAP